MTGREAPALRVRADAGRSGRATESVLSAAPSLAGTDLRISVLEGGLTNRNFRVSTGAGRSVVARFSSPKTELLGIDRDAECGNARAAARCGVAPGVVDYLPDDGVLIVDWVDGRTFTDDDLDDDVQLGRVAAACARLHAGARFVNDFDMFAVQRRYLSVVRRHGFWMPADYLSFEPALRRIEQVLRASGEGTVPCHNDLLAANIIDDGERLWLIDFEYSGNNDACFELGNIWSEAALEPDRLEHLVTSYFGAPSPVRVARARLFGLVAKYGWTLWASIQDAVSEVDFDFREWGTAKYERARAEFSSPVPSHLIEIIERSLRS